jgi:anti-sigma B factor antagonist
MLRYRFLGVRQHGDVTVVCFGEQWILDNSTVDKIHDELNSVVHLPECRNLLLNLAGVTFVASRMLGKLLVLQRTLASQGGRLKLCEVEPQVQEVFAQTKLNQIIDIHGVEADALKAFGTTDLQGQS